MPVIQLTTFIEAPIEICFDLSRDIDAHQVSASQTKERAVDGRTSGLCEENDVITWRAVHFGMTQKLTVRINKMKRPEFFEDEMIKGAFQSMRHTHTFKSTPSGTEMMDHFEYVSPLGILGKIADSIFLKSYMTRFLKIRNGELKRMAENRFFNKKGG